MKTTLRICATALAAALAADALAADAGDAPVNKLRPCDDDRLGAKIECGTYRVREDRESGTGRALDLKVLVMRRLGDGPAREPVFLLAGGPGQGGTALAQLALMPLASVRKERDFVMVDLRGTGESNPLECDAEGAAEDPQRVFGHLFDPAHYRTCAEELRRNADLRLYTTPLAIEDLDEIRAWLGYEKVILWGGSFGTRAALVYLRRHPESVLAAVLDSPAPTSLKAPLYYARDSQRALDRIFEACRADADCRRAFPDLRLEFQAILRRFDAGPVETGFTDAQTGESLTVRFHRGDFGYAVRGLLYRGEIYKQLPAMIHEAATSGDLGPFAAAYWQRARGLEPAIAEGLHISTICAEDTSRIRDEEIPAAIRDSFLGDYLVREYRGACDVWDVGSPPADYYGPVSSGAPVLILTGDLDPTTPPSWGREAARALPNALHVTVPEASHGVFGTACGSELTLEFLRTPSFDGLDPSCAGRPLTGFETGE